MVHKMGFKYNGYNSRHKINNKEVGVGGGGGLNTKQRLKVTTKVKECKS